MDGDGSVEVVSPKKFIQSLEGWNTTMSIYVSCQKTLVVGSGIVAERAKKMIGTSRNYQWLLDKCHKFTAGCLTGNFDNSLNFLWMLRDEAAKVIEADTWRVWELDNKELFG